MGWCRRPFKKMFGSELYRAFCALKDRCDPEGLFNPGKIVRAPPLTANLRYGPQYRTSEPETAFDFSDFGSLAQAAEQCSGGGPCRKTLTGAMCPSYMATRDERASTTTNCCRFSICVWSARPASANAPPASIWRGSKANTCTSVISAGARKWARGCWGM